MLSAILWYHYLFSYLVDNPQCWNLTLKLTHYIVSSCEQITRYLFVENVLIEMHCIITMGLRSWFLYLSLDLQES